MEVSLFDEQNLKQGHFTPYQSNSPLYYYEYFTKDIIMQAWPSSLLFSDMIQNIPQLCQNRVILDLSCGVGIVGQVKAIFVNKSVDVLKKECRLCNFF